MHDKEIMEIEDEIKREQHLSCLEAEAEQNKKDEFRGYVERLDKISSHIKRPKGLFRNKCPLCSAKLRYRQIKEHGSNYDECSGPGGWWDYWEHWECPQCSYEYGDYHCERDWLSKWDVFCS